MKTIPPSSAPPQPSSQSSPMPPPSSPWKRRSRSSLPGWWPVFLLLGLAPGASTLYSQTLLNIDFGVGHQSPKTGFAATGQSTNDFWNLYRHYDPKFVPGSPLVHDGELRNVKLADATDTKIFLTVSNAPGVWGNASGDPMYDTYLFANNGSNLTVVIHGLETGRYHFYLYGHADPDTA